MFFVMQPFTTFMNMEDSRSFIDDLYTSDNEKCLKSLICIKNSVIGSNRQKESVINQGIVPRLLQLLEDRTVLVDIRVEAAVTIGSLAEGKPDHVDVLLNAGTIQLFLNILQENNDSTALIESCLRCLRTLSQLQDCDVYCQFYTAEVLKKLLSYAATNDSIQNQSCVASILSSACKTATVQDDMCSVGAPSVLAKLLAVDNSSVRIPVLTCLAQLTWKNSNAAGIIAGTMYGDLSTPQMLAGLVGRARPVEVQLEAAGCVTNLYRSHAIAADDPLVVFKTMPCLVRLVQDEHSEAHRARAAETLAYLTEVDSELQQIAAISNQVITALASLLNCSSVAARKAAFRSFASLGANDENIRKRIIGTKCLMDSVLEGLEDENEEIRLAAVRCLHSLSRSVQQLRTTFQDHSVWKQLMSLMKGSPSTALLSAASSAMCNLLLEFSPAKEPMLQQGVVQLLANLTEHPEPNLRLNGVWALMNLAFQVEHRVKSQILSTIGTNRIFLLLGDSDPTILMKTLGLLRNLVSPRAHTDHIMSIHGMQVMQSVVLVLEGPHAPEVKEQALCILGNIADGEKARDQIMNNEDVLKKIIMYMTHSAPCLQEAAVFCINNLIRLGEPGALERQAFLKERGVLKRLQKLLGTTERILYGRVKGALMHFTDV